MKEFCKLVGMDVHKKMISVSVAVANGGEPRYLGEIANTPEGLDKLVKQSWHKHFFTFQIKEGPAAMVNVS
jgi:hypothetical protein